MRRAKRHTVTRLRGCVCVCVCVAASRFPLAQFLVSLNTSLCMAANGKLPMMYVCCTVANYLQVS